MNDDLDDLRAMMDSATPRPDAARRAENLALAQKNFDDLQGSRTAPRPTSATKAQGLWTGVKNMLDTFTSKAALTTTTALVACGFLILTPAGQDLLRPGSQVLAPEAESNLPATEMSVERTRITPDEVAASVPPAPVIQQQQNSVADVAQPMDDLARALPEADESQFSRSAESAPEVAGMSVNGVVTARTKAATDMQGIIAAAPPAPSTADQDGIAALTEAEQAAPAVSSLGSESFERQERTVVPTPDYRTVTAPDTESFPEFENNALKITAEDPVSTFSIDVDTAAYSVVRSSLMRGQMPPRGAIRIEEMINYFPYDYAAPEGNAPFQPTVSTFQTPWNPDTQLVHIALQGEMPALDDRPPLNLVFLVDTSGSMNQADKLPLLKQSFRLMLDQLRPRDEVAIVAYAGSAGQVLAPTPASDRTTILNAIQSLQPGGGTNGQGGLQQAYALADKMKMDGEVSRVILATDGDFNIGISNPDALKNFIATKRDTGTYLSVLGFGRGNLDDATMQALAQNGNGTAAYIDTLSEAQKVLVDQLTGALFTIAGDVKVQVEFNPARIAEYRLIGYETRSLRREDFNNDAVDAGELGAGHTVTAIYEITPVGSPAQLSDPLRYAPSSVAAQSSEFGFVKLRYKKPGDTESQLIATPIIDSGTPGTEANFAAAIAGFGQALRGDPFLGDWGYDDAITLANANRGGDEFGYRTEAVQLMRLAQSLSR
ncbi:vWA domain-containing protein [Yoonia sediminilitoris]|uniref:Ca-activated chloride channel family protein n=1 Tax=Yoonia sediminilitoris TaxID=1286148 RepID=A0A2T6K816_9RHOB|nr:VWA domain-containing protein [Yoonia sediminilitoris]PUB10838.1 Ca-activated chloride channel family protein [Yoonia sediminilitoris]RCW90513.1 Ca-activated chloride channel family protein [Yoonia sediminilitoris]